MEDCLKKCKQKLMWPETLKNKTMVVAPLRVTLFYISYHTIIKTVPLLVFRKFELLLVCRTGYSLYWFNPWHSKQFTSCIGQGNMFRMTRIGQSNHFSVTGIGQSNHFSMTTSTRILNKNLFLKLKSWFAKLKTMWNVMWYISR